MSGRVALAAALLLGGCQTEPAQQAADGNTAAPEAAATPAAPAGAAIGTRSSLSAQTSALRGEVTAFQVEVTETATIVTLAADTLFAFDKADIAPEALANLQLTADAVRKGGAGPVVVTGHSDAKGEDAYNLALSTRRAQAVADWLKGQAGLGSRSFTVVGKGESEPVAPNAAADGSDDPDGRARNRRVVVTIPR